MSDLNTLLFWQKIHGHLAMWAVALAWHPVLSLRPGRRVTQRARLSAWLGAAFLMSANLLGWLLYPQYRQTVKPELYTVAIAWGDAFETKEHLAFHALLFALAGAALLSAGPRATESERRAARAAWLATALLGTTAGALGVVISSVRGF